MPLKEIKTSGIVVRAEDYRDSDRLLRLLTPDLGLITAKAKGVKKDKAKLKFAAMPFSFCEYNLFESGSFYTVKTASAIESLIGLTETPEKYLAGSVALECAGIAGNGSASAEAFVRLLKTLKRIIYSEVDPFALAINHVFYLLKTGGYVESDENDSEYDVPVEDQLNLTGEGVSRPLLARTVRLFEHHYCCSIKSASLI